MYGVEAGLRLRSQVCATEVIVVRGAGDIDLRCGGQPMIFATTPAGSCAQ